MRVVERFLAAKTGSDADPDCEDAIVVTDELCAIIDGATDKTGRHIDGISGGRYAMLACVDALRSLHPGADAHEAISHMTGLLARRLPSGLRSEERPEAAVTVYSRARREVWQVGDVRFWYPRLLTKEIPQAKMIDVHAAKLRAAILRAERANGADPSRLAATDPGRVAILGLLAHQGVFRNNPGAGRWAYAAIDGRAVPAGLVTVHRLPGHESQLVIASDGYPRILPTLKASEEALARLLARDPMCVGPLRGTKGVVPGNSSYDDRAYLRLQV